ncbi:MAG: hypothetical protein QGF25_05665 [Candidatus Woesearchaeota archaeon]|jgi:hypothetical protein|nr:hypothetical protein [Candidatus Woesearchaeota archaeon]MDP7467700.1 hypothetical protein [Candidatus Woesearchaeota archaeon]MDP7646784.1 hypothetical protein [Candidatus Woesearchaeota archaeon]|tara:strand:+ start:1155 stop:1523 length:369 start_codon:yes stop_codon:yes gene_type:complete
MMEEGQQQDYFNQKRIELMIDMANKKVLAELEEMKRVVKVLETEIVTLKQKAERGPPINKIMDEVKVEEAKTEQQPTPEVQQEPAPVEAKEEVKSDGDNRYGDYTSDDVSVDKFFYFGNKKE